MKALALGPLLLACAACGSDAPAQVDKAADPAATASSAPQPKGRFAPRDDCAAQPGASEFRQRLIEAVQLRDADAFAALADPAIKLDFGGGSGIDELKQKLRSGDALWKSLEQLLTLGCAMSDQGNLVIPWLFAQDLGSIDVAVALLVTGEDVPVLSAPRASSEEIAAVSWDFVSAARGLDREQPFTQVTFPLNRHGYVATDKLRSVLDYRLLASRRTGQWRVEALVAGD